MICYQVCYHPKKEKAFKSLNLKAFNELAEWTGLEPATPGVTGRYSNQLNYHSNSHQLLNFVTANGENLVGANGVEPLTFAL